MINLEFLVQNTRVVDATELIIDHVFKKKFAEKGQQNHVSILAFQQTSCFRSASIVKNICKNVELKKKGVIILNPDSIHYGTGDNYNVVISDENEVGSELIGFINSNTNQSKKREGSHKTIILNFLHFSDKEMKYVPNWLNGLVATNRTFGLDIFMLLQNTQLDLFKRRFMKVLQNTDNITFVQDFNV